MNILTLEEKRKAIKIARISIAKKLGIHYMFDEMKPMGNLMKKYGVFVTLEKNGSLRGCIGFVYPVKPLYKAIEDMAKESAYNDPRFSPLQKEEFEEIEIEISVMSPLKKITSISDIKVGQDGLLVKKDAYSGLLLPQVAEKYGWNNEEFLSQTCIKAGLPYDIWQYADIDIYTFQAEVFGERSINGKV